MATNHIKPKIQIEIDNKISLPMGQLSQELIRIFKERLIFENPGYLRRVQFGKIKRGEEPWIFCIWQTEDGESLILPRGYTHDLTQLLHGHRMGVKLIDSTQTSCKADFTFRGGLYGYQKEALEAMRPYRFGILKGAPGVGKKVISLEMICERQVPTLVVVKTRAQLYQWISLIKNFMALDEGEIGRLGDGHMDLDRNIIIAIDRSLYRHLSDLAPRIGFLIVDQCHLVNLKIFFKIVLPLNCPYMLGLSSVSKRSDGLENLMRAFIGPVRHEIAPQFQDASASMSMVTLRKTDFNFEYLENYGELIGALVQDENRNDLVLKDILQETADPKVRAFVVSERVSHLQHLGELLDENYKKSKLITSRISERKRNEISQEFNQGKLQVVLTTLKGLSNIEVEGANRFFVVTPLNITEHFAQIISTLLKGDQDKQAKIFDYLDSQINVLKASFARRLKFYKMMQFSIE